MKAPVFLTDTQKSEMVEMYNNGSSIRACARQFQVDTSTAYKWLRVAGVQLRGSQLARRIYTCDEFTFEKQFDPEHTYWFGFLLADGCISQRTYGSALLSIALAEKDTDHLEKFRQFLKAQHPIRREPKTHSVRLSILSNTLCESLIKRGCTPRKSLELEYPAYGYLYRRHFIRGYFDGDGSIYVNEQNYCFPTVSFVGTQKFLEELQGVLVLEAGIQANTVRSHPHTEAKYLSYGGRGNAQKIYDYLYAERGICLERKKAKFEYVLSYQERKRS